MQQLAINRQKHYTLRWYKDRNLYAIKELGTKYYIVKREYEEDIQIDLHTFPNPMTYNPSGNINRGGTIIISYRNYKYEIVFQLGRGDLRIVKCQKIIMAEMIVSLSVLMMAVSLLLPQTVLVMQERKIYKFVIRHLGY